MDLSLRDLLRAHHPIAHFTRRPAWYSAADRRTFTNDCEEDTVQQGGGVAAQQAPAAAGPARPAGAAVAGPVGAVNLATRWARAMR